MINAYIYGDRAVSQCSLADCIALCASEHWSNDSRQTDRATLERVPLLGSSENRRRVAADGVFYRKAIDFRGACPGLVYLEGLGDINNKEVAKHLL